MQVVRHRQKASLSPLVKFIAAVAAIAAASYGIATLWHNALESAVSPERKAPSSAMLDEDGQAAGYDLDPEAASAASSLDYGDDEAVLDGQDEQDGENEPLPETQSMSYERQAIAGAVPQNDEPVGYNYFNDAIFFGDSISTGIPLYMITMVPDIAVVATQGVNTMTANTRQLIDINGTQLTMIDAAKTKGDRKKVYIMLGANSLDLDENRFIDGYTEFVRSVFELYPDAAVYIQSILPVTENVNEVYPGEYINNDRIEKFNGLIRDMAKSLGANYVDVAQAMVDGNGMLPTSASPFDGMHLTPEYYIIWFDYLRYHTV